MARGQRTERFDAVVVGGGPGGLSAARHLHKGGLKVLLVDARRELGTPLRCAEATRPDFFDVLDIAPEPDWIRWRMENAGGFLSLNRHRTESGAGRKLAQLGVDVRLGCSVIGVGPYEDNARTLTLVEGETTFEVHATVVIAADGVSSRVARLCRLDRRLSLLEIASTIAYRMENLARIDNTRVVFDYRPEISPHYFWIIPTGAEAASVGLGVPGHRGHAAKPLLDRIMRVYAEVLAGGRTVETAVGWYPSVQPMAEPYTDGVLVIGGAARLVGAATGEGIWQAAVSGREAARAVIAAGGPLRLTDRRAYRASLQPIYDELAASWNERRTYDGRSP